MSKDRKGELSTSVKRKYRIILGERYGWRCVECGIALIPEEKILDQKYVIYSDDTYSPKDGFERATLDHIIPLSIENIKDISNFRLLCHSCNAKKGNRA